MQAISRKWNLQERCPVEANLQIKTNFDKTNFLEIFVIKQASLGVFQNSCSWNFWMSPMILKALEKISTEISQVMEI